MPNDNNPQFEDAAEEEERPVPASVTFMEIMRRAAAAANPEPADEPDESEDQFEPPQAQIPTNPLKAEKPEDRQKRHAAALEVQRIKRVERRRAQRRRRTVGTLGGMLRSFMVVSVAAGLMATIFVWWTPSQFLSSEVRAELGQAQAIDRSTPIPTVQATPNWLRKIGVVAGHRGPELDPGAVCPDGLTEAEITFDVAQRIVRELRGQGYSVDLLDEFDPRLENYQAAALVSVHANTCATFSERVSGYLVAAAAARVTARLDDTLLVDCIAEYYQQETGLERHSGITEDMTNYHTFREIHPLTPAAIVELGFMLADRDLLTNRSNVAARGVANGVLCYMQPGREPTLAEEDGA